MGEVINYAIPIHRRVGDKEVEGWYIVRSGIITVWHSDGRKKSTQVGGSPDEVIAKLLLLELELL